MVRMLVNGTVLPNSKEFAVIVISGRTMEFLGRNPFEEKSEFVSEHPKRKNAASAAIIAIHLPAFEILFFLQCG